MFEIHRKEINWGGRTLSLETGHVARQADGAVVATYGDTAVLCTVVADKSPREGLDFFPLTVNYMEKTYSAGKIPGGFFKREGRPSEKETLTCRLIDRPIRPLFPAGFRNETQVVCTVLSHDMENDPDLVALIGVSAALTISGVPFMGPIAGARVGFADGAYVLNPAIDSVAAGRLDLIVAGTRDGVLMVESEADEMSEDEMLGAVMFGHEAMQPVLDAIIDLAESCAKAPWDLPPADDTTDLEARIEALAGQKIRDAYGIRVKQERTEKLKAVRSEVMAALDGQDADGQQVKGVIKKLEKNMVRGTILDTGVRIDGRDVSTVRPIRAEVGFLPRAHGSALFTRGETQALVITTLGTGEDEQIVDALPGSFREHFLLHYNFPPYSVGETGRVGFTSRREVGHGKLAWRALRALMPEKEAFPYTIRVVSEITESNGSSSMATVCGSSLSMMDAGVPLTRPVAGIAMGLIKDEDRFAVLSDILGDEDHLGDMDFKVAGSESGITALQMDIKITGITEEIMRTALGQARDGRLHILGEMAGAIDVAREDLNAHAPRIETLKIPREKIREVIGTGGKVIREICEVTGAKIDIADDGTIKVAASDLAVIEEAVKWIQGIAAEPEVGHIYSGKVVKVVDFGAFVNFFGSRDGLVHISELAANRVAKVGDVVAEGDEVKVKVLAIDERGKVRLSMRVVDQESGEALADDRPPRSPKRGPRG